MAFVTDSNRPQPLWQPPPTAYPTASGTTFEAPSLPMRPWHSPLTRCGIADDLFDWADEEGGTIQTAPRFGFRPPPVLCLPWGPAPQSCPLSCRHLRANALRPGGQGAAGGGRRSRFRSDNDAGQEREAHAAEAHPPDTHLPEGGRGRDEGPVPKPRARGARGRSDG